MFQIDINWIYVFVAGLCVSYIQQLWNTAWTYFTSKYRAHVTIDPYICPQIYDWLFEYFSREEFIPYITSVRPNTAGTRATETCHEGTFDQVALRKIDYMPADGTYLIPYNKKIVYCTLTKIKSESRSLMTLSVYSGDGTGRIFLENMIMDIQKMYVTKRDNFIVVTDVTYRCSHYQKIPKRKTGSIILKEGMEESIVSDARAFLTEKERYANLGIPHRRGYLFHGPPGTGKSSFVTMLATILDMSICILNIGHPDITDDNLFFCLRDAGRNSIVLFEDIDCVFKKRGVEKGASDAGSNKDDKVTLSGLLNALDGVCAGEGRIVIMTSNHPELLDPALVRPGRVDRKYLFDYADDHQIRSIFRKFYPAANGEIAQFAENLNGLKVTMAELQTFLLTTTEPKSAARGARTWIDEMRKQDNQ